MTEIIPLIETTVHSRLEWQVRRLLATSGLGLARGAVGIGKTFSLNSLQKRLTTEGIKVNHITCKPTTEGSYQAFVKSHLSERRIHYRSMVECVEVFEQLVMGRPYGFDPKPSILIVDECQGMRAPVLTFLRQLWDEGDEARITRRTGNAFAMLLCGNNTFLNRNGVVREMDLHPLSDRVTSNLKLPSPSSKEIADFAQQLCEGEAARLLTDYGKMRGNFRSIAQIYREACDLANGSPITAQNIKDAIIMKGGLK